MDNSKIGHSGFQISCLAIIVGALALVSNSARAQLIGQTIEATGYALSPASATIGPGVEFAGIYGDVGIDFGADTLTLTGYVGYSGFGEYTFSGFTTPITGISLDPANLGYADGLDPTFTSNSITLDFDNGDVVGPVIFDIQTGAAPPSTVPDGGTTAALLGGALIAMAALASKYKRFGVDGRGVVTAN